MNEMIEWVAQAMCSNLAILADWDELSDEGKGLVCKAAKAAIEAMREPTLGMEVAAADKMMTWRTTWFGFPVKRIRFAWRAMIDAALEGKP